MKKYIRKIVTYFLLILVGLILFPVANTYVKRSRLIHAYNQIRGMDEMQVYDVFYLPEEKLRLTREEYKKRLSAQFKPTILSEQIISVTVKENTGTVKTKTSYCLKSNCINDQKQIVGDTWFIYQKGKWFLDTNHNQCTRSEPYNMPEEFNRAVSLIVQRFMESTRAEDREFGKLFSDTRNCLDIQYAENDTEILGAEGLFLFSDDSPRDHLIIMVSPRYKYKDDITTSLVLVHELYHAMLRGVGQDISYTCFDNEAYAYTISYNYYFVLNQDEQNSLLARYERGDSSELSDYFDTNKEILNIQIDDTGNRFREYVSQSKYYQEQCTEK